MQLCINLPDNIFFGINQTEQSLTSTFGGVGKWEDYL
jgi:hypothetical protein